MPQICLNRLSSQELGTPGRPSRPPGPETLGLEPWPAVSRALISPFSPSGPSPSPGSAWPAASVLAVVPSRPSPGRRRSSRMPRGRGESLAWRTPLSGRLPAEPRPPSYPPKPAHSRRRRAPLLSGRASERRTPPPSPRGARGPSTPTVGRQGPPVPPNFGGSGGRNRPTFCLPILRPAGNARSGPQTGRKVRRMRRSNRCRNVPETGVHEAFSRGRGSWASATPFGDPRLRFGG